MLDDCIALLETCQRCDVLVCGILSQIERVGRRQKALIHCMETHVVDIHGQEIGSEDVLLTMPVQKDRRNVNNYCGSGKQSRPRYKWSG